MSSRHQPLNGADSAQGLADAIAIVENAGLSVNGRVGPEHGVRIPPGWSGLQAIVENAHAQGRSVHVGFEETCEQNLAGAIVPRCIACSESALPDSPYCKGHDRLATYTAHESAGGIAANE